MGYRKKRFTSFIEGWVECNKKVGHVDKLNMFSLAPAT